MTVATEWNTLFDPNEYDDIKACAGERGVTVTELIHDAVMEELYK